LRVSLPYIFITRSNGLCLSLGSESSITQRPGIGKIGSLREKGHLWAACTLDDQSNSLNLGIANPKQIREATEVHEGTKVSVFTATRVVKGEITEYSLVALDGTKAFYKMWPVYPEQPLCK
jgi:hypothetical protein